MLQPTQGQRAAVAQGHREAMGVSEAGVGGVCLIAQSSIMLLQCGKHRTNNTENYIKSGILYTSISDHFPVFSLFSISTNNNISYIHLTKRIYENDKIKAFKDDLKQHDWIRELENTVGADKIFDLYMEKFLNLYNNHFPIKSFAIQKKYYGKPSDSVRFGKQ